MPKQIDIGDAIPHFSNLDGEEYLVSDLDLVGHAIILFFYPQDNQPFSRQMVLEFRDRFQELATKDVVVVGVSADPPEEHRQFKDDERLPFLLLSDQKLQTCHLFGVWETIEGPTGKTEGIVPTTFLIDRDGIIQWVERNVNLVGHLDHVLEAIGKFL